MNTVTLKQQAMAIARQPNELDLVQKVVDILQRKGHCTQEQIQAFLNNHHIVEACKPKNNSEVQRWLLNRYWTDQLNTVEDSMEFRLLLLPDGDLLVWLNFFEKRIAPFLFDNKLPRNI